MASEENPKSLSQLAGCSVIYPCHSLTLFIPTPSCSLPSSHTGLLVLLRPHQACSLLKAFALAGQLAWKILPDIQMTCSLSFSRFWLKCSLTERGLLWPPIWKNHLIPPHFPSKYLSRVDVWCIYSLMLCHVSLEPKIHVLFTGLASVLTTIYNMYCSICVSWVIVYSFNLCYLFDSLGKVSSCFLCMCTHPVSLMGT